MKGNRIMGYNNRKRAGRIREVIILLYATLTGLRLEYCPVESH